VSNLPLADLVIDPSISPRAGQYDADHIDDLTAAVDDLPPVVVYAIGGKYHLADGFHSFYAHAGRQAPNDPR